MGPEALVAVRGQELGYLILIRDRTLRIIAVGADVGADAAS